MNDLSEKLTKIFELKSKKTTLETSGEDSETKLNFSLCDLVKLTKSVFISKEVLDGLKKIENEAARGLIAS
jgi:hypothetical protein